MLHRRCTRHNLCLSILNHLLCLVHLPTLLLPEMPHRCQPVQIPRIRNTGHHRRETRKAGAPDIPFLVKREVVERHAVMYGIDLFERLVVLKLHDADFRANRVRDVVEAVGATNEAVGEIEAFRGGDMTAVVIQGAVDEAAAAGEGFKMTLLSGDNVSFRGPQDGQRSSYKTSCEHQVSCKIPTPFCHSYLSQSDHW
jgi:hypothetical protein